MLFFTNKKERFYFFTLPQYVALLYFFGHRVRFLLPLAVLVLLDVPRKSLHLPAVVVVEEVVSNLFLLERRHQAEVGSVLELRARLTCHEIITGPPTPRFICTCIRVWRWCCCWAEPR